MQYDQYDMVPDAQKSVGTYRRTDEMDGRMQGLCQNYIPQTSFEIMKQTPMIKQGGYQK